MMEESLEIAFHNVESSAAVEAAIRERFAKLEKHYDRLVSCRVSVEALHRQHRTGNIFEVHIDMLVPGAELVVSKQPQKAKQRYANPDVYTSIRDAFDAAERQLKRFKRQQREDLQPQAPLFQGQIVEMHPDEDWGYLLTKEGALLYFHRNAVLDGRFDGLQMGDVVHYVETMGDTGPTAAKVWQGPEHDLDRA
jgi:ribosomal subunit interface protein